MGLVPSLHPAESRMLLHTGSVEESGALLPGLCLYLDLCEALAQEQLPTVALTTCPWYVSVPCTLETL